MSGILAASCCCSVDPCSVKGTIRICWSQDWVAKGINSFWSTDAEVLNCFDGPYGPSECPPDSKCELPAFGACDCSYVPSTPLKPCAGCLEDLEIEATYSFTSGEWCLDFTYKSSFIVGPITGCNWVYSPDNGATTVQTNLPYAACRLVDVYDDNVVVAYNKVGSEGVVCAVGIAAAIGTTLPVGDWQQTAMTLVRYHNRARYLNGPAPFRIRRQTVGSQAIYFEVKDIGGVKHFVLLNAALVAVYAVDISTITLQQLYTDLDTQVVAPLTGFTTMNVATGNLPAALLSYVGATPIPTLFNSPVDVYIILPQASCTGPLTEWYQCDAVAPYWQAPFSAVLKNDLNPQLAFSAGFGPAAEAMFCMGYRGDVFNIDCGIPIVAFGVDFRNETPYNPPVQTPGFDCTYVWPGGAGFTIMGWGQRSSPLPGIGYQEVNSDDICDTFCSETVTTYNCEDAIFDCFLKNCEIVGLCRYVTIYAGWRQRGYYTLQRIV